MQSLLELDECGWDDVREPTIVAFVGEESLRALEHCGDVVRAPPVPRSATHQKPNALPQHNIPPDPDGGVRESHVLRLVRILYCMRYEVTVEVPENEVCFAGAFQVRIERIGIGHQHVRFRHDPQTRMCAPRTELKNPRAVEGATAHRRGICR